MAKFRPVKYVQEVKNEMDKVTWPSRRETTVTSIMVLIFVFIAAIFFLLSDQLLSWVVGLILGRGLDEFGARPTGHQCFNLVLFDLEVLHSLQKSALINSKLLNLLLMHLSFLIQFVISLLNFTLRLLNFNLYFNDSILNNLAVLKVVSLG